MTEATDLRDVRASGMCIACGACCAADPSVSLELSPEWQIYQPASNGGMQAAGVCPAIAVDYQRLHQFVFATAPMSPLGLIKAYISRTKHGCGAQ